ncbi:cation:dicarboxylate symporter family transporter [Staphylococcus pseudintermedius]|nr:cation:dicarboxylase symporter family transporter [Staphylococcus pseudintermedius]MDF0024795.1 cation:dicarboxylase symporter family transporter [Staphylococcus pseudintermedius]
MVGFGGSSSNEVLPVSMEITKKIGVKPEITSFVQPLAATIKRFYNK